MTTALIFCAVAVALALASMYYAGKQLHENNELRARVLRYQKANESVNGVYFAERIKDEKHKDFGKWCVYRCVVADNHLFEHVIKVFDKNAEDTKNWEAAYKASSLLNYDECDED